MADKKKRGESGKANAESSPFRLNGGGVFPTYMRSVYGMIPGLNARIGRPNDGSAWDRPIKEVIFKS